MNSLLKAARQALEALLSYEQYVHPLTDYFGGPEVPREGSTSAKVEDAITALRAAIEQAQRNEFNPDWDALAVMVEEQQRMAERIEELEAQQKPWVKTYAGGKPNYTVPEEQEPGVTLDASAPLVVQPHPAFKKWQGLTDEDREDILRWVEWKEVGSQPVAPQKLIAYVERKLREKNT